MLPGFGFLSGFFALLGSGISSMIEDAKIDSANRRDELNRYDWRTQNRVEEKYLWVNEYDHKALQEKILYRYPKMNRFISEEIAIAAINKYVMELKTPYKYKVPSHLTWLNFDELMTDVEEVKKKV